jgi:DNA polymerase elongation subunit (family B)
MPAGPAASNPQQPPSRNATAAEDIALFGRDATERIVDVQPLLRGAHSAQAKVRLYRRRAARDDGSNGYVAEEMAEQVTEEIDDFFPFFFLSDRALLEGFPAGRCRIEALNGDGFFRHLVAFRSWSAFWDGVHHVEEATGTRQGRPDELYFTGSPVQQYLLQSGRTCLKGMDFEDLHRLQLDIETRSDGDFPNAERPEDQIILVALSDNRGWERLLDLRRFGDRAPESVLLEELVQAIREKDPDVIEGHNCFQFDFDYIRKRCRMHGVSFAIGRDGSVPRTYESSMRFAERVVDFPALDIAGRHVIDTYFQVMAFDVFKRDLPGYGLKAAARYFGFASEDRTYVAGDEITALWEEDPERLRRYALDDVRETRRLAAHLSGSTFYLTQMLPMPYGQAARTGPASKIESLFVREYLRERRALPRSQWGSQSVGGYTDIFLTGAVGPVVYADVESLYPSIMLADGIQPRGDTLDLFPRLLRRLTDLRFAAKRQMKSAGDDHARGELDARQSSYKVLINSFYGSLGFSLSTFNDFEEADKVTRRGQELLRRMIGAIKERGGDVIEADTDGVFFVPPEAYDGRPVRGDAEDEQRFTERLTEALPEGIRVGFDGRYRKMLSYKKKNYALLDYDDSLKFKGSSLVARSSERFGRRFVRRAVRLLLEEDLAALHTLYVETRARVEASDWPEGARDFTRTETLKDTLSQYEADVAEGRRTRTAPYELAHRQAQQEGREVRKGDRISYYVTGSGANVTAFKNCKLADDWSPEAPDENTAYYLTRLDRFTEKFAPFFEEHDFRRLFSPEDLFGFSTKGIEIQTRRHEPAGAQFEDEVPF